jgi:hypothetical protein
MGLNLEPGRPDQRGSIASDPARLTLVRGACAGRHANRFGMEGCGVRAGAHPRKRGLTYAHRITVDEALSCAQSAIKRPRAFIASLLFMVRRQ